MKNILAVFFCLFAGSLFAQTTFSKLIKNDSMDKAYAMFQSNNGDYFILGSTNSFGAGKTDIHITKTDGLGKTIWSKTYGSKYNETGLKIKPLFDGGAVVVGYQKDSADEVASSLVFKITGSGTLEWTRSIFRDSVEVLYDVTQAKDGIIYATGYVVHDSLGENLVVQRISNNGTVAWTKSYGSVGNERGYGITENRNRELVIVGSTDNDSSSIGGVDLQLLIVDGGGTIKSMHNYGTTNDEVGKSVIATNDNKYIVGGNTKNSSGEQDIFTCIIDTNNNVSNVYSYGLDGDDELNNMLVKTDGNYLLASSSNSPNNNGECLLLETTSSGQIETTTLLGGQLEDATGGVFVTNNIVLGTSILSSGKSGTSSFNDNLQLAKLDEDLGLNCLNISEPASNSSLKFSKGTYSNFYANLSSINAQLTLNTVTNKDSTLCCRLVAEVTADTLEMCLGDNLKIGGSSISGVNYNWSVTGSTFSSTVANPTVSPTVNTSYKLVVSSSISQCLKDSATVYVKVNQRQNIEMLPDTFYCFLDSVVVTAASNMNSYSWAGASISGFNQSLKIKKEDTIALRLIDNNSCIYNDTIVVTEKSLPVFNLGTDTSICDNLSITLSGPAGMTSYNWNGSISTNQTFITSESKLHTLEVVDNSGCSFKDEIQVLTNPSSTFSLGPDTSFCEGSSFTIFGPTFLSDYKWNDTASSSFSLTVSEAGEYWLEAYNRFDCPAYDTISITMLDAPTFSLGNDAGFCEGGSVLLEGPKDLAKYLWFNGSSLDTFRASGGGLYFLTVTDDNNCSYTDSIEITEFPNPVIFLGNDTTILTGNNLTLTPGSGYVDYNWSTGASTESITVNSAGNYSVEVTDNNNCMGSDDINVQVSASVINLNGATYQVFPNPADNRLYFKTDGNVVGAKVSLTDFSGKLITQYIATTNSSSVDVSALNSGAYFFNIKSEEVNVTFKVIVSHR